MIVSHKHRFIFFAQPRTGTHAVRAALQPHLDADDWQQQALTETLSLPILDLARIGHGHISLQQAQTSLPSEILRQYFKFAIVRNPYDRYVSICTFMNKHNPGYAGRETAFMNVALTRPRFRRRVMVRPQVALLANGDGTVGMDFVGRYERLQQSFDRVCERIGIPPSRLPHLNASRHADYGSYYDKALLNRVNDFYRADFEQFGYPVAESPEALACL